MRSNSNYISCTYFHTWYIFFYLYSVTRKTVHKLLISSNVCMPVTVSLSLNFWIIFLVKKGSSCLESTIIVIIMLFLRQMNCTLFFKKKTQIIHQSIILKTLKTKKKKFFYILKYVSPSYKQNVTLILMKCFGVITVCTTNLFAAW